MYMSPRQSHRRVQRSFFYQVNSHFLASLTIPLTDTAIPLWMQRQCFDQVVDGFRPTFVHPWFFLFMFLVPNRPAAGSVSYEVSFILRKCASISVSKGTGRGNGAGKHEPRHRRMGSDTRQISCPLEWISTDQPHRPSTIHAEGQGMEANPMEG